MKNILQCSICLENLKSPVSLNCGHTFCYTCIQNCFDKSEFCACPLCRQPALLSTLKTDELLPIVEQIYETEGIQSLLNEFPSLIICLCCGLTPVNPVVLPCQHMFCLKCIEESLQQELLCPACSEFSVTLNVNTNQKYKDLIDWYLKEFKIEEEQVVEQSMQFINLNGIPLFHYVSGVPIFSKNEFSFLEFRYQEMIKIVSGGSGHFVISKDMKHGDLVKIMQIKRTNKGYLVKLEGVTRLDITSVYNYNNGIKIEYQQWNNQSLGFCDCILIQDLAIKEQISIQYQNLLMTLQQLIESSKSSAEELFQNFIQKLKSLKISESSLVLLFTLNNDFEEEYYNNDIERRIQLIQQHLMLLEQKIQIMYGAKESAKQIPDNIQIVEYQDQSIASQYLLNLFNINKILYF